MDFGFHNAGDVLRFFIFVVCATCLILLGYRFFKKRGDWNTKTRDYWFSLVMWSLAGAVIGADGIFSDRSISPKTVLVTMAALVSLNGLRRKGNWGGED